MDDAGEPRLPRKKGTKWAPSSVPPPPRGRDRCESLWRDYHDFLKETEAKKRRLEGINQRKLGLLAEVKMPRELIARSTRTIQNLGCMIRLV
ncbi:hypothetical protein D1007_16312 [Hordeum vulgare]|nr:hypothetical protein D1007_16312 [Hordeum vulgare]